MEVGLQAFVGYQVVCMGLEEQRGDLGIVQA